MGETVVDSVSVSIKIAHLADIHLGYRKYHKLTSSGLNQREADINAAFQEALRKITFIKPQLVLIAGDLFHSVRPSNATVTFCFKELKKLSSSIKSPIIIVAGNHETPRRQDTGSILSLFKEIDGVFVADSEITTFDFPEMSTSVCAVPHASLETLTRGDLRGKENYTHNILLTHVQTGDSWMSDIGGEEKAFQTFSPHEWDYIALGHVHMFREVSLNAFYSGSIEHTSLNIWSEAQHDKGFLEVTLPTLSYKFHSLTSPREVHSCAPLDAHNKSPERVEADIEQSIESIPGGISGKIIRLQVMNASSELVRQLNHKKLRELKSSAAHFALEFRPPERQSFSLSTEKKGLMRLEDELFKFLGTHTELSHQSKIKILLKEILEAENLKEEAL